MLPAHELPIRTRARRVVAALSTIVALIVLAPVAEARTLTSGGRGADVQRLNERLAALGYLPAGAQADTFGAATRHGVIAFQKQQRLTRDGVVGKSTEAALATAGRPRPQTSGRGRRIEVLLDRQVILLVVGDQVTRTIAVSTGAPGYATPAGAYRVFRKEIRSWSHPYRVWLPYASYFNRGIAFHGYPSVPTYPASHGCVRVPVEFMAEVYAFARMGTPVHVLRSARASALPGVPG